MLAILKKVDAKSLGPHQKFKVNIKIQLYLNGVSIFPDYLSISYNYVATDTTTRTWPSNNGNLEDSSLSILLNLLCHIMYINYIVNFRIFY